MRLVLAGNRSRLQHLMTTVARARSDLQIVARLDDSFSPAELEEALLTLRADVAVLDPGEPVVPEPPPASQAHPGGAALARTIVERMPQVVVVVLQASGRRAVVHNAVYMDDVGLNALIDTMRSAHRGLAGRGAAPGAS